MALQGTIDAFPLADVLQLLSTSSKSGRLLLEGDRGRATLWMEAGRVVGGSGPGSAAPGSALSLVAGMLRFSSGNFVFDAEPAEAQPEHRVDPAEVAALLEDAREQAEKWRAIEATVPSMAHRVRLAPVLPSPTVTVDRETWAILSAAGPAPRIDTLAENLGLDEYAVCTRLVELVDAGLLEVDADAPTAGDPVKDSTDDAEFPEHFPIDDLVGDHTDGDASWDELIDEALDAEQAPAAAVPAFPAPATAAVSAAATAPVKDSADEVLRQMSRLSPQAAEAIAAALQPESTDELSGEGTDSGSSAPFLGSA